MGLHSLLDAQEFHISDFINEKIEVVEKKSWGDHLHLQELGMDIKEMVWHDKPKRFLSPWRQIELYFNWLAETKDYRTRRVVGAYLFNYYVPVEFREKEDKEIVKKEIEIKSETVYEFYFGDQLPRDNPYGFEMAFGSSPEKDYEYWVVEADPQKREFALTYGYVTAKEKLKVRKENMRHIFYTLNRAKKYTIRDFKDKVKSYLCTSIVYGIKQKSDFRRISDRVTELSLLFCELDYYKQKKYKKIKQNEMEKLILAELDKHGFDHPTEVVFSRGIHLVWKISPIPAYRAWEWKMLQDKIHMILEPFGADSVTKNDTVRLLRMVGTIHEKTKNKIHGRTYTDDRYLFDELIDKHCAAEKAEEIERRKNARERYAVKKEKRMKAIDGGRKDKLQRSEALVGSHHVGNIIHEKYMADLFKLVAIRDGKMDGFREFCCFLVRYWTLCITDGKTLKALVEMRRIYDSLDAYNKYSWEEIVQYTKSAEKAYLNWKNNWLKGYNYKNDTLVDFLSITKEEQQQMNYLIDDGETKRREAIRDAKKKADKRAKKGTVSNRTLEEAIKEVILNNPQLGIKAIALAVREKIGKCSDRKVTAVKSEMIKNNEI
jgi:hypothetical protein